MLHGDESASPARRAARCGMSAALITPNRYPLVWGSAVPPPERGLKTQPEHEEASREKDGSKNVLQLFQLSRHFQAAGRSVSCDRAAFSLLLCAEPLLAVFRPGCGAQPPAGIAYALGPTQGDAEPQGALIAATGTGSPAGRDEAGDGG